MSARGAMFFVLAFSGFPLPMLVGDGVFLGFVGGVNIQALYLFLLMFVAFIVVLFHGSQAITSSPWFWVYLFFIAYSAVSVSWSPSIEQGLRWVAKISAPLVFLLAFMVTMKRRKHLLTADACILVLCLFLAILAGINTLAGGIFGGTTGAASWGIVDSLYLPGTARSVLSFLLGLAGMLALGKYMESRSRLCFILFCIFSLTVLWSFVRIGMAGYVVGVSIIVWSMARSTIVRYALVGTLAVSSILAPWMSSSLNERTFMQAEEFDLSEAISDPQLIIENLNTHGRTALWQIADQTLADRDHFFGAGLGAVDHALGQTELHSEYFRLYLELGIFGLACFALVFVFILYRLIRLSKSLSSPIVRMRASVAIGGLSSYLITLATDNSLSYVSEFGLYVFAFVAFALVAVRVAVLERRNAVIPETMEGASFSDSPAIFNTRTLYTKS